MSEPILSEISLFANNFAPRNWAVCNGQLLAVAPNTALYALLGTVYGGDGRSTFGVPDLKGRSPLGSGTGPGLYPKIIGQKGGSEVAGMSLGHLPPHTHSGSATSQSSTGELKGTPTAVAAVKCNNTSSDTIDPTGKVWGKYGGRGAIYADTINGADTMHAGAVDVTIDMNSVSVNIDSHANGATVQNSGVGGNHENMPQFLVSSYYIATEGIFPSRNY